MIDLSLRDARRMALAAQGFTGRRSEQPASGHIQRTLDRLGLFQIDNVNVLTRAHYLPAFAYIGSYDRAALERAAGGERRHRLIQ